MSSRDGTKTPIVLLRGLIRGQGHWAWFPDELRRQLPDHPLEFIDLPGNGDAHQLKSPLTLAENLNYLREKTAQLIRPFHILSISLGGMVAYEWARSHPQDMASLALINSSFRGLSPFTDRLIPATYPRLLKLLLNPSPELVEAGILETVVNDPDLRSRAYNVILPYSLAHPVSRVNFARQLWSASRFKALERPSVPTLLMASRQDRLVSCRCSEAAASAWGATLKLHPMAGHDLPIDDSPWVAKTYRDFLEREFI